MHYTCGLTPQKNMEKIGKTSLHTIEMIPANVCRVLHHGRMTGAEQCSNVMFSHNLGQVMDQVMTLGQLSLPHCSALTNKIGHCWDHFYGM